MAIDASMYVLNPVFKADTFQETVAPLTLYAQAYKEQEAKIEDMTDKAAALEWIANQNPESQTAALYRDMSDKIKGIRDNIINNGLMGDTRSRILSTRKTYSANSAEIMRRYQDMVKYKDRMDQLHDKDNSIRFSSDSSQVSLDDFAGGSRPKIKAISGNEIMTRGAAVGKRFTSQIFGDGVEGQAAGDQFWRIYKEQGMTDDALRNALKEIGQSDKYEMASKVINGIYDSFSDFNNDDQLYLKSRFLEGFYDGSVYNRDVSYTANPDHMTPMMEHQVQMDINEDKRKQGEYDREEKDYNFMNGYTYRKTWIQGDDGKLKQVLLSHDPYTGELVVRDVNTKEILDHKQIPTEQAAKEAKAEEKKQKAAEAKRRSTVLGIDADGQKVNVTNNKAQGVIITGSEADTALAKIKAAHPDEYIPGVTYRIRKYKVKKQGQGTTKPTEEIYYYADPVVSNEDAATTAESNSQSSNSNTEADTITG